jgi:HAE1 family hydrophobic/amphiphilic exporter-1
MPREPLTTGIPRFSVTRPVTVVMILLTILLVGFIAYARIPIALHPEGYESTQLHVQVSYPNASPRDIEEKITRKIEDIVGTVPDVKRVSSYASTGFSYTRIEFQTGTNIRAAYAALSDRMDRVKPQLPDDIDRIYVRRFDQNDQPMMNIVAQLPPNMDDAAYRLEHFVKPALQRIEGVGNVEIFGIQGREVQVELLDERLRSHRIDVSQMVATLRNQNFALSAGYVYDSGKKVYVRSLGRFTSAEEIGSLIIDPERRLRLSDVANVSFRLPRRDWVYRVDGKPAIGLWLTRESSGNIERISREVRATLAALRDQPQLTGINFEVFFDQGTEVRKSIANLEEAGYWGGAFAAVIVFIFLRAPRMTCILTLSIPVSLLCTLIVLFFMGWSMNMATMMGLLLAVGMVVDNAIVIVENIYRRRQEGEEATSASIYGAGEVGLAVLMSTCTNIVVFLPLMLMSGAGEMSFWMLRIGVPVIVSLVASLFIALVFIPLAAQRLSRGHQHKDLKFFAWLRRHYLRGLHWVLTHRVEAFVLVALAMATITYPMNNLVRSGGGGPRGFDSGSSMHLFFEMPSGNTLEQTDEIFAKFEQFLNTQRERYNIDRIETRLRYNNGRVQLKFKEPDPGWLARMLHAGWIVSTWESILVSLDLRKPAMDRNAIEQDIKEKYQFPPGVIARSLQRGSGGAPQDSAISISLYGEDTSTLLGYAEEAVRRLRTIPGLLSVDIDSERSGQELQIQLDRDRARMMGVNPQSVSGSISNTIRGVEVGRFNGPDGRELRVFAQLGDADRTGLDDVRSMTFRTDNGVEVPLESLAKLNVARSLGQIQRESRQTIVRITARAPRQDSRTLISAIDKAMEGFDMPRGYRWDKGDWFRADSNKEMMEPLLLAIVFVFLLMGLLFESVVLPLAVIIAVPFSMLGVYWMLFLTKTPQDMMANIGIVILVGVVVNNAIVLVDMTNRLRAQGKARFDALMEAGMNRFRPIMMTTLTTVCGLIPMAVGNAKVVGMSYAPMGRTMIGGLIVSTILTLVIVPLFYTLLDDFSGHLSRLFNSALGRKSQARAVPLGGAAAGVGRASRAE